MKTTQTLSLLLATSVCLIVHAAPPVFTFTTGVSRLGWWACDQWHPDQPQGQSLVVTATSDGTVSLTGTCTESASATVTFTRTAVNWSVVQDWWGCGRCVSGDYYGAGSQQPRIACSVPFYTEFVARNMSENGSYSPNAQTSWVYVPWELTGTGGLAQQSISANGEMGITFCRDDFDASGTIDGGDIGMMMLWWGASNENQTLYACTRMDLDEDSEIGASDLALLLLDWGECPTPDA
jgi:hypothetical protein